jgi:transglutaminase-like putative cysteine protease
MIITGQIADHDRRGRPAPTLRVSFGSQREQVKFLRQLVNTYANRLPIRELAVQICRDAGVPSKNQVRQAKAIAEWVGDRIYYVNERRETFQTPIRTLKSGLGDCDDTTSLIGALCESIAIPVELVAIGVNSGRQLTHIYPRAICRTPAGLRRVNLDATIAPPHGLYQIGTDPAWLARQRGDRVVMYVC